jgi:thiol-disulfide isomerase/thioredoxin
MKKYLLLGTAALLAVFTGCNRSGVIDGTSSASPAGSPASAGSPGQKSSTPARIARGKEVDLQSYVVPGKTTIFDFTSEYCPPCRAIAPLLHKLHADRADVVVVEVDINRPGLQGIDFASPVARQFQLGSIPAFKIYGPNGRLQAEGDDAYQQVRNMLR